MAKPFYYGGQAVMEGVMMRGRSSMAVAVRQPDGNICIYEEALQPGPVVTKVRNWPFIRGVFVLWDTLLLGMRALIFSANVGLQEVEGEEPKLDKDGKPEEPAMLTGPLLWATVGFSLLFSIALFFVAPLVVVGLKDVGDELPVGRQRRRPRGDGICETRNVDRLRARRARDCKNEQKS